MEGDSEQGWKTVTRRKPFPSNWRHAPEPPNAAKSFIPYLPSFAQVVRRSPPNEPFPHITSPLKSPSTTHPKLTAQNTAMAPKPLPTSTTQHTQPPPPPSSPPCPAISLPKGQYISTHTKPALRFPPSPTFPEWRGRCFRCCQQGHTVATCKNPTKCGRCWGNGHIGARCMKPLNPSAKPSRPLPQLLTPPLNASEPSFDELLEGDLPLNARPLPQERPAKAFCYIPRDVHHHQEIVKLENAVVLYAPDIEVDLSIDQVAEYAVMTGLVGLKDVSIGILTRSRYLIQLPPEIQPSRFIKAIPDKVWNLGFSFSQWSQASDTRISIPKYKALLDLVGVPMHLSKEEDISKAISSFGVYLGTLEQNTEGDLAYWTVAVAITELENIPYEIDFVYGGLAIPVEIRSKGWLPCPLYKQEKLPRIAPSVSRQPRKGRELKETEEGSSLGETISLARNIIIDLCRGRDIATLPPEVREVMIGEKEEEQHGRNRTIRERGATEDPSQNILYAAQGSDKGDVEKQTEGLMAPKEVSAVAGQIQVEVISTSPANTESASHRINSIIDIQPNAMKETRPRALSDNEGEEPSQRNSRVPMQGLTRTAPSPTGGAGSAGVTILHRRSNSMPPGGHDLRPSTVIKRKARMTEGESSKKSRPKRKGPPRKPNAKKNDKADLSFNPEGFLEVHVDFQHCANLAEACGIRVDQISELLNEDNHDRSSMPIQQQLLQISDEISDEDQGERISDFDPLTEDELSSCSD